MEPKTVWQTDDDGYLVGATVADPCQLEPGVYLIPGGCVEVKPPHALTTGQEWRWVEGEWVAVPARTLTAPDPAAKLAAFLKNNPDVAGLING